jgi:hypothetical protein
MKIGSTQIDRKPRVFRSDSLNKGPQDSAPMKKVMNSSTKPTSKAVLQALQNMRVPAYAGWYKKIDEILKNGRPRGMNDWKFTFVAWLMKGLSSEERKQFLNDLEDLSLRLPPIFLTASKINAKTPFEFFDNRLDYYVIEPVRAFNEAEKSLNELKQRLEGVLYQSHGVTSPQTQSLIDTLYEKLLFERLPKDSPTVIRPNVKQKPKVADAYIQAQRFKDEDASLIKVLKGVIQSLSFNSEDKVNILKLLSSSENLPLLQNILDLRLMQGSLTYRLQTFMRLMFNDEEIVRVKDDEAISTVDKRLAFIAGEMIRGSLSDGKPKIDVQDFARLPSLLSNVAKHQDSDSKNSIKEILWKYFGNASGSPSDASGTVLSSMSPSLMLRISNEFIQTDEIAHCCDAFISQFQAKAYSHLAKNRATD